MKIPFQGYIYQHFDFLPEAVLNSLVSLQTCIENPDIGLVIFRDNVISAMTREDIPALIEEYSPLRLAILFAPIALTSNDSVVRRNYAEKLHAGYVLFQMDKFASINSLLKL